MNLHVCPILPLNLDKIAEIVTLLTQNYMPWHDVSSVFSCWEIVQLVGLQTLNLAILVRVQVSQPIFSMTQRRPFLKLGNIWEHYCFELGNCIPLRLFH